MPFNIELPDYMGMILGFFVRPDQMLADLTGSPDDLVGPKILFPIVSLAVAATKTRAVRS